MSNTSMKHTTIFVVLAVLFTITANSTTEASPIINFNQKRKTVIVTNAHWNFLSVRCFSFDNSLGIQHLRPWQQFIFPVRQRVIYPTSTMYNCSTNMGTFVAFKHDYECAQPEVNECQWRFDLKSTYRYSESGKKWDTIDYNPNYESLAKGGVVKGRYVN